MAPALAAEVVAIAHRVQAEPAVQALTVIS
jgi:hypothetical protein